jgi:hypothetical protein
MESVKYKGVWSYCIIKRDIIKLIHLKMWKDSKTKNCQDVCRRVNPRVELNIHDMCMKYLSHIGGDGEKGKNKWEGFNWLIKQRCLRLAYDILGLGFQANT